MKKFSPAAGYFFSKSKFEKKLKHFQNKKNIYLKNYTIFTWGSEGALKAQGTVG